MLSPSLNELITAQASHINYVVSDHAPSTFKELNECLSTGNLVVWAGASDKTIYGDPAINWAFRAWHDTLHFTHGLDFSLAHEMAIAELHCCPILSDYDRELLWKDTAGQITEYNNNGEFIIEQAQFVTN